jgi:hypothetical protein
MNIEELYQMMVDAFDLHNRRSIQTLATMSDIQTAANTIQTLLAALTTHLGGVRMAVDAAVADRGASIASNNSSQLDSVMTILTAIQAQVDKMATEAEALQAELTTSIASASPLVPVVPPVV